MDNAGAFKTNDIVIANYKGERGCIVAFRHAVGNHNTGALLYGADLLMESAKSCFCFLHDLARYNPEKLAETFGHEPESKLDRASRALRHIAVEGEAHPVNATVRNLAARARDALNDIEKED